MPHMIGHYLGMDVHDARSVGHFAVLEVGLAVAVFFLFLLA